MPAEQPIFYYDFNSPYAYFAAQRIDQIFGESVRWQPFSFGFLLLSTKRIPWSLGPNRESGMRLCEKIAVDRGLAPIKWPPGWPDANYSINALRGALAADRQGALKEYSLAAFHEVFANGRAIQSVESVADIARSVGLDPVTTATEISSPEIKDQLRAITDRAVARGVVGIPTIEIGETLFWGDDKLEEAAAQAA